ncbi:acyltransferase [Mucilaginibacter robiniae]|uniref:Acyltransferase n=1 Tax=Mucilaginibacter robiniae TaxID=2728022 RepID=A0A7L5DXT7_9SPHI|nr:acyltransferase [Mucilaginibacter robiniae]QJD94839.1 acyltransferase [Mucilaginibacter robiniae]
MNNTKTSRLDYINSIRGIAVLMVIVVHISAAIDGLPETFKYICGKGAFGVQLFFVTSAFTLSLSYNNRVLTEGEHTNYNFFIRRLFRISPMYHLAALVYGIICYQIPAYNDGKPLVLWKMLANVLYLNGFLPGAINYLPPGGWSVGVEMAFYCCVPFLFTRIKTLKSATIWFITLLVLTFILKVAIRYVLTSMGKDYQTPENWFLYFWFPNQTPVFMLGLVLYYALKNYSIQSSTKTYIGLAGVLLLLAVFAYFRVSFDPYNLVPEYAIVAMFFTVNVFLMAQHPVKILNNRVTCFFGEISFSLYLIHFIVIYVLADYLQLPGNVYVQFFILLLLTLSISSVLAKLAYHFIELKGIKLGNRLIRRKVDKLEQGTW